MPDVDVAQGLATATAEQLAPLEAAFDSAYPERLRDVATCLYLQLLAERLPGIAPPALAGIALRQTELLSQELGGGNFYMHKGTSYRLSVRDREMCGRFKGNNFPELARAYDLTEQRVRQIVAAWQREELERRQSPLFSTTDV